MNGNNHLITVQPTSEEVSGHTKMSSQPISEPMSVKEIVEKANAFEFNPFIALKYWLRTAETLLKEVRIAHIVLIISCTHDDRHKSTKENRTISRHICC